MKKIREMPLAELMNRALDAVARELGPVGYIRFIQQYHVGSGD